MDFQQQTVASKVERLVERAMTFAVDEHDDGLAVARLAWLAQDDHAALEEAGEVCLGNTELDLVVRGRATGLWLGSTSTTLPLDRLAAPVLVRPSSRALHEPPVARGQTRPVSGADRPACRTRRWSATVSGQPDKQG